MSDSAQSLSQTRCEATDRWLTRQTARAGATGEVKRDMVAVEPEGLKSAGPLSGLRVVDLSTRSVAEVQASQLLADFGAEVVWVEPPRGTTGVIVPIDGGSSI